MQRTPPQIYPLPYPLPLHAALPIGKNQQQKIDRKPRKQVSLQAQENPLEQKRVEQKVEKKKTSLLTERKPKASRRPNQKQQV